MSRCRYDQIAGDYLIDGEPCRTDEYGDPTKHCTARRTCSQHIGRDELTCLRCISRGRSVIRQIADLSALMMPAALASGLDSEAVNLAGPATDPTAWSERRIAMRSHLAAWEQVGRITEHQHLRARVNMEDDDEHHPYVVLTRWAAMISEDYDHGRPVRWTITNAAAYLDRQLTSIAQDPEQDWPLLVREMRTCRDHLAAVLRNSHAADKGAPCPTCASELGKGPKLRREYGHWCEGDDCEQIHYDDDSGDVWRCPRVRDHWWSEVDYRLRIADVYADAVASGT